MFDSLTILNDGNGIGILMIRIKLIKTFKNCKINFVVQNENSKKELF